MYFQTSYFLVLIVTFNIQVVYSNVTLSAPKTSYICDTLKLRCQYSGVSSCCSSRRVWKRNGNEIMNGGVESSTTGKYSEFFDNTAEYFELTIQNPVGSDFGEKYVCEYDFDTSLELRLETELICYPCYICGLIYLGYALAAMPIGLFLSSLFYWLGFTCFKSYWSIRKYFCIAFDENAAGNYSKLYGEEFSNKRRRKALIIAIPVTIGGYVVVYGLVFAFWIFGLQCPSCEGSTELAVLSFGVGGLGFLFIFYMALKFQRDAKCSCKDWCFFAVIVPFIFVIVGIIFMFLYLHFCLKDLIESIETTIGKTVRLICPYQAESGEIKWIKLNGKVRETYSDGTAISQDLPRNLRDRLKVDSKDLCISNVQASDAGIYECVLFPKPNKVPQCSKLNLIVSGGGNTQSAKSGSSCWPPCRVDQDPETRSHAPVNVGRSSERPTPNKEKGKKPVARVSSQPQTAHHVKTENTASAVSSTEKEPFKPRPLPNIVMTTETPRPLPMMPPGTQQEKASNKLDPIETTGEKKKKKKRRKKETDQTKQTDVENSTEL